ncbi:hypothetical protein LJR255_004297 [Pararhizobium sp. LjRoot255]|uniref:hypothetical protein n=1 Tax=Pararhizobium sp. LjRoot255 TaxID=3342298 RepID=UPI003ED121BF
MPNTSAVSDFSIALILVLLNHERKNQQAGGWFQIFGSRMPLLNEHRPKIVDVRKRRPRFENIADRIEGGPAVVAA